MHHLFLEQQRDVAISVIRLCKRFPGTQSMGVVVERFQVREIGWTSGQ